MPILAIYQTQTPFAKSWCSQPLTVWVDGAVEHEADHGERDYGLGHLGQLLVVAGQAAPAAEPAECTLDHLAGGSTAKPFVLGGRLTTNSTRPSRKQASRVATWL